MTACGAGSLDPRSLATTKRKSRLPSLSRVLALHVFTINGWTSVCISIIPWVPFWKSKSNTRMCVCEFLYYVNTIPFALYKSHPKNCIDQLLYCSEIDCDQLDLSLHIVIGVSDGVFPYSSHHFHLLLGSKKWVK